MSDLATTVLLVEADPARAERIRTRLDTPERGCSVSVASGEEDALAWLERAACTDGAPPLRLVVLGLDRSDPFPAELVRALRDARRGAGPVPVVVLAHRDDPRQRACAHANHVNSYVAMPSGPDQADALLDLIGRYWLGWNRTARAVGGGAIPVALVPGALDAGRP